MYAVLGEYIAVVRWRQNVVTSRQAPILLTTFTVLILISNTNFSRCDGCASNGNALQLSRRAVIFRQSGINYVITFH